MKVQNMTSPNGNMAEKWTCTCEATYNGFVKHCPLHAQASAMAKLLKDISQSPYPCAGMPKKVIAKRVQTILAAIEKGE